MEIIKSQNKGVLRGIGFSLFLMFSFPAWGAVTGFTPCSDLPSQSPNPTATFCTESSNPPAGYLAVRGMMTGSTSFGAANFGTYHAPLVLLYPDPNGGPACSGSGIVDFTNNTGVFLRTNDGRPFGAPLQSARFFYGNDFFAARGHVVASIQHQRVLQFGANIFELGKAHGYYPPEAGIPAPTGSEGLAMLIVMRDAASFVRNAGTYVAGACNSPMAIAHGYSASAVHLRILLSNAGLGFGTFDGSISGSLPWTSFPLPSPANMGATPPQSGKVISVHTETDVLFFRNENLRADADHYKVYEIAGVSHVPAELAVVSGSRQNPAKISPVMRTMMDQLIGWIDGLSVPPSSVYLDASFSNPACVASSLDLFQINNTAIAQEVVLDCPDLRDADNGNVLSGGVRLPHVATEVDGELVGAPLGIYQGVEIDTPYRLSGILPNLSLSFLLAGVFVPFTDGEIAERYGIEKEDEIQDALSGKFLGRVAGAAEFAESQGWISEEEKIDYIHEAQDCVAGKTTALTSAEIRACHGL